MKDVANLLKILSQKIEAMNKNGNHEGEGSSFQQNEVGTLPIQVGLHDLDIPCYP